MAKRMSVRQMEINDTSRWRSLRDFMVNTRLTKDRIFLDNGHVLAVEKVGVGTIRFESVDTKASLPT